MTNLATFALLSVLFALTLPRISSADIPLKAKSNIHVIFGNVNGDASTNDPAMEKKVRLKVCTQDNKHCDVHSMGDRHGLYPEEIRLEASARLINEVLAAGKSVNLKGTDPGSINNEATALKRDFPIAAQKYIQYLEMKYAADAMALDSCTKRCPSASKAAPPPEAAK